MFSSLRLLSLLLLLLPFFECQTTNSSSRVTVKVISHSSSSSAVPPSTPSSPVNGTSAVSNSSVDPVLSTAVPSNTTTSLGKEEEMEGSEEELEAARKMNVHVQRVKGHRDSSYRERLLASAYVVGGRVVVLRAVSSLPVDLFVPPVDFSQLQWNPQQWARHGSCRRLHPSAPFEQFVCRCFRGYGGRFCSREKNSKRWVGWLWWPLILTEAAFLLFALARFWKRWTLPPVVEPRRFVEFIMAEGSQQLSKKEASAHIASQRQ